MAGQRGGWQVGQAACTEAGGQRSWHRQQVHVHQCGMVAGLTGRGTVGRSHESAAASGCGRAQACQGGG